MQNDYFINLVNMDWTDHNKSVLRHCIQQANEAAVEMTKKSDYPLLDSPHHAHIQGTMRWGVLNKILADAADNQLFEGITAHWVKFMSADILELRGKYTSLTACHVLSRDEKPKETAFGYRKNNRAKNQKNLSLFSEIEAMPSEDDLLHIVLLHGGRNEIFAYLRIYLEDSDSPALSDNLMLMAPVELTPATELVSKPTISLKPATVAAPEILPTSTAEKNHK